MADGTDRRRTPREDGFKEKPQRMPKRFRKKELCERLVGAVIARLVVSGKETQVQLARMRHCT